MLRRCRHFFFECTHASLLQRRLLTGTVLGSIIGGGAYVGTSDEATIRFFSLAPHDSSGSVLCVINNVIMFRLIRSSGTFSMVIAYGWFGKLQI